jgi:Ni/Fe-hydrogenase subunit HybB-like protein
MAGYLGIKLIGIAIDDHWRLLATGWGMWYLVEVIGFVAFPAFLFAMGVREKNLKFVRWAAAWTVLGIVLNRLNISVIAFNYHLPSHERYVPSLMEIGTSVFIVTLGIVIYRFITTRMPVLHEHPDYSAHSPGQKSI